MNLHIVSDPVSDFWKCPKKFFFIIVLHFLTTFFTPLVYRIPLNFFKSPGSWHECRPIYGLHFVYIGFFILYTKKGVLVVQKKLSQVSGIFWPF